jgi:hypothetical protein
MSIGSFSPSRLAFYPEAALEAGHAVNVPALSIRK